METTITINWESGYNVTQRDIRKIMEKVVSKMADGRAAPFEIECMTHDDEFTVTVEVEQK